MRLLVVSHPCVRAVNQLPYAELQRRGWDPFLVVPSRWRDEYATSTFEPELLPELAGQTATRFVFLSGHVQRHGYLARLARIIAIVQPQVAFVEQEPTSVAGFQWSYALARAGVPFGLQAAENLDRSWPMVARLFRRSALARTAFVAARSPTAAELVRRVHPDLPAPLIPHHVPAWTASPGPARRGFVVGYAGRLVPEKGIDVLIEAAAGIEGVTVRLVGNGPLKESLADLAAQRRVRLEIDSEIRHQDMAAAYASFDVLVLPSRSTATWVEQFGRVLVEALWCEVPIVASDSGEIPWVVRATEGGLLFPEGDPDALRRALVALMESPARRRELARRGRTRAQQLFSIEAVAGRLDTALREAVRHHAPARRIGQVAQPQHHSDSSSSSV